MRHKVYFSSIFKHSTGKDSRTCDLKKAVMTKFLYYNMGI